MKIIKHSSPLGACAPVKKYRKKICCYVNIDETVRLENDVTSKNFHSKLSLSEKDISRNGFWNVKDEKGEIRNKLFLDLDDIISAIFYSAQKNKGFKSNIASTHPSYLINKEGNAGFFSYEGWFGYRDTIANYIIKREEDLFSAKLVGIQCSVEEDPLLYGSELFREPLIPSDYRGCIHRLSKIEGNQLTLYKPCKPYNEGKKIKKGSIDMKTGEVTLN